MKSSSILSVILAASTTLVSLYAAPAPLHSREIGARNECDGCMFSRDVEHASFLGRRGEEAEAVAWLENNVHSWGQKPILYTAVFPETNEERDKKIQEFKEKNGCITIDEIIALTGEGAAAKNWTESDREAVIKVILTSYTGEKVWVLRPSRLSPTCLWKTKAKSWLKQNKNLLVVEVLRWPRDGDGLDFQFHERFYPQNISL